MKEAEFQRYFSKDEGNERQGAISCAVKDHPSLSCGGMWKSGELTLGGGSTKGKSVVQGLDKVGMRTMVSQGVSKHAGKAESGELGCQIYIIKYINILDIIRLTELP
jgi:hypothetical protein